MRSRPDREHCHQEHEGVAVRQTVLATRPQYRRQVSETAFQRLREVASETAVSEKQQQEPFVARLAPCMPASAPSPGGVTEPVLRQAHRFHPRRNPRRPPMRAAEGSACETAHGAAIRLLSWAGTAVVVPAGCARLLAAEGEAKRVLSPPGVEGERRNSAVSGGAALARGVAGCDAIEHRAEVLPRRLADFPGPCLFDLLGGDAHGAVEFRASLGESNDAAAAVGWVRDALEIAEPLKRTKLIVDRLL